MRWLVICLVLLTSGCSGRIDLSDAVSATGAAVGAAGTAVLTTNPAGILVGALAGGAAGGAVVADDVTTAEACSSNPDTCHTIAFYNFLNSFWHWLVGAGVVLMIAAWLIPGPQRLWRKNHGKANSSAYRAGQTRRY